MSQPWFCICQSGDTVDGRKVEPQWLKDAAETYDPATYGARINVEHIYGWWPNSEWCGYGDVVALKAEEAEGVIKLFAQIDPTDKLIELNKRREKVYTSAEFVSNFAQSGKSYLVGLAITDQPASLGTTMLQFTKSHPSNFISESIEIMNPFAELIAKLSSKPVAKTEVTETQKPIDEPIKFARLEDVQELQNQIKELSENSVTALKAAAESMEAIQLTVTELKTELASTTEALRKIPSEPERELHGGNSEPPIVY